MLTEPFLGSATNCDALSGTNFAFGLGDGVYGMDSIGRLILGRWEDAIEIARHCSLQCTGLCIFSDSNNDKRPPVAALSHSFPLR
jgi:hypothetical protein